MNAWLDPTASDCDTRTMAHPSAGYQLNVNDSVQSLVSHYPETERVLTALGFDVAGLGWLPLRTVAAEMGLDLASVCGAISSVLAASSAASAADHTELDDDLLFIDEWRVEDESLRLAS